MLPASELDEVVYGVALDSFGDGSFGRRALMHAAKDYVASIGAWAQADDEPSESADGKSIGLANVDWAVTRLAEKGLLKRISHGFWRVGFGDGQEPTNETMRRSLINARRGQGQFRSSVMELWNGRCCVTGVAVPSLLIASHVKPWRDSSNAERLDAFNGLLLSPSYDATFDRGLITFEEDGSILLSPSFDPSEAKRLGISPEACIQGLKPKHKEYLVFHRNQFFGK